MTSKIENMKPRDMWMGLFALAIIMTVGLLLAAMFMTAFLEIGSTGLSSITINALLFAVAISILATGVRAILSIVDWFEERRIKREQDNG